MFINKKKHTIVLYVQILNTLIFIFFSLGFIKNTLYFSLEIPYEKKSVLYFQAQPLPNVVLTARRISPILNQYTNGFKKELIKIAVAA